MEMLIGFVAGAFFLGLPLYLTQRELAFERQVSQRRAWHLSWAQRRVWPPDAPDREFVTERSYCPANHVHDWGGFEDYPDGRRTCYHCAQWCQAEEE